MSVYKFVKGSRLFMQGKREKEDYDNVADTFAPTQQPERHLATLDNGLQFCAHPYQTNSDTTTSSVSHKTLQC